MSNSTIPDMKELFRQAAEIAQQVPENMQVAAFNRALDLLTGASGSTQSQGGGTLNPPVASMIPARRRSDPPVAVTNVDELIAAIDTTQHPAIGSATKALDRALMVLQIALRSHNLDGMTPPEIAKVLTEKFRLNTSSDAVTMALGSATNLVNRVPRGRAYEYKIMGPGEEYLKHLGSPDSESVQPLRNSFKAGKKNRSKAITEDGATKPPKAAKTGRAKSGRIGPKQMLETLITDGYFGTRRDIAQIIKHLQDTQARTYKNTDLSPSLTRLLREKKLEREKNDKGIFEYVSNR
jgi:hypothetical protein